MRVNPDSRELFRLPSGIDLLVEEIGNAVVVELDGDDRADLFDQLNVFDEQQIVGVGDAESADFGGADVTQVQQLCHRVRGEPQAAVVRALRLLRQSLRFAW